MLAMGRIGSAACCVGSVAEDRIGSGSAENRIGPEVPTADSSRGVAPGEAGTDSVGDRGVEGVDQRDGSSLLPVVGYLCLHRTKSCSLGHTAASSLVAKDEHLDLLGCHYRKLAAKT